MATINYYLKAALSDKRIKQLQKENPVYLNEQLDKKRIILVRIIDKSRTPFQRTTGLKCSQERWDKKNQNVKTRGAGQTDAFRINGKLSEISRNLNFLIEENAKDNQSMTIEQIETAISPEFVRERKKSTLEGVIEDLKREYALKKNKPLGSSTIKKYSTLIKHVSSFQDKIKQEFSLARIDEAYVLAFMAHLTKVLDHGDNTSVKYVKGLKSVLNFARRKKLIRADSFNNVKVTEKPGVVVALLIEELALLSKAKLKNATQEMVRDVFIFMVYTGQRFSDVSSISYNDINIEKKEKFWFVPVKKTNELIRIKLDKNANHILDKYAGSETPLPKFSNQFVNREIKDIAKLAELNRDVKKIDHRGGKQIIYTIPLHEYISSHTARKTFVSLLLQNGISELDIRKITGHKDNRSFLRYADLMDSHCERINNIWGKLDKVKIKK